MNAVAPVRSLCFTFKNSRPFRLQTPDAFRHGFCTLPFSLSSFPERRYWRPWGPGFATG